MIVLGYLIGIPLFIGGFIFFIQIFYVLFIEPILIFFKNLKNGKNKGNGNAPNYHDLPSPLNNWHLWH